MNRFEIMFSPIDTRKDQMQAREKHSDPVLLSGVKLYQILSNASAVKYCQALSIFLLLHMFPRIVTCGSIMCCLLPMMTLDTTLLQDQSIWVIGAKCWPKNICVYPSAKR